MNMTEATRPGLKIYGYEIGPDGKSKTLVLLRELSAATLERRFRALRTELDEAAEWHKSAPFLANARYIGVSAPRPTLAYGDKPLLARGRPRKNRKR
ncbi:hypothetical protein GRI99_01260 [Altererythrobacter buctensis]|uniref:Uncharacterized protein n=2 Tax=Alteraurantiacibacter buctensis TaxID=1503981 RepID=A0A844YRR5_9SPHN|nr:hypothetical protein [Alteraurantiacibacter buctensis]